MRVCPVKDLSQIREMKIFSSCTREIKQLKDRVVHKHKPKKRNDPRDITANRQCI